MNLNLRCIMKGTQFPNTSNKAFNYKFRKGQCNCRFRFNREDPHAIKVWFSALKK